MKKIVLIISTIIMAVCLTGCVGSYVRPISKATEEEKANYVNQYVGVVDITIDGHTHQYLYTGGNGQRVIIGGHWEDCKYCK